MLDVHQICIHHAINFTNLLPFLQMAALVQICLIIVYTQEEGQYFVAYLDGDLTWSCPNCGGKGRH